MRADNNAVEDWWAARLSETEGVLVGAGITAEWWSFKLGGEGVVQSEDDIHQAIALIAQVPAGADPLRPEFASQVHLQVDRPMPEATPQVVRELIGAVERWEPRIQLTRLDVRPLSPSVSGLTVRADWTIDTFSSSTEVALDA